MTDHDATESQHWVPGPDVAERVRVRGITLVATGPTKPPLRGIIEPDGLIAAWMTEEDAGAVLVRPDHIVFGSASGGAPEEELLQALEEALSMQRYGAAVPNVEA